MISTIGENNIDTPKIQNDFIAIKLLIFPIFFSIAPSNDIILCFICGISSLLLHHYSLYT